MIVGFGKRDGGPGGKMGGAIEFKESPLSA
jgi:hypothetical protein